MRSLRFKLRVKYVLGFVLDNKMERIALIFKNRPDFLAGKWNALGGKVEEGETEKEAVKREVEEESGLVIEEKDWQPVGVIQDNKDKEVDEFKVDIFYALTNDISKAKTLTDEEVEVFYISDVLKKDNLTDHLPQIISTILKGYK